MIKKILFCCGLLSTLLIISCGSSGGRSSPANVTIGGTGGKGLMGGATVSAYAVNPDGSVSTTALGTTTSSSSDSNFGAYSLSIPPTSQPVIVQMTANSTTQMLDETRIVNGVQPKVAAPTGMMLRSFVSNATSNNPSVSINPFTEMAVASIPTGAVSSTTLNQAAYAVKTTVLGGSVDPFTTLIPAGTSIPSSTSATPSQLALFSVNSQVAQLATSGPCSTQASTGAQFNCVISDSTNGLNNTLSISSSGASVKSTTALTALKSTTLPTAVSNAVGGNAVTLPTVSTGSISNMPSLTQINAYASADTFVKNLSTSLNLYSTFLSGFKTAAQSISNVANIGTSIVTGGFTTGIGSMCKVSLSINLMTCNTTNTYTINFNGESLFLVTVSENSNLIASSNAYFSSNAYLMTFTQIISPLPLLGSYKYTIVNSNQSYDSTTYSGSVTYYNNTETITGTAPNPNNVHQPITINNYSINISTSNPTANQLLSATVNANLSANAVGSTPSFSLSLNNGTISGSYDSSGNSHLSNLSGSIILALNGTNTFNGQISAAATSPSQTTSFNTKSDGFLSTASLTGTVTLSNGDTATGTISETTTPNNVSLTSPQSSSNYALGNVTFDLFAKDATSTNYAEIKFIDQRTSYTNANVSAQIWLNSSKSTWVEFTSSYTIDTNSLSPTSWLAFTPSEGLHDTVVISSSGGYGGNYSVSKKSADITDINSNIVGKIINDQIYIDGGVTLVNFASTPQ
jgi:hypothetical protein